MKDSLVIILFDHPLEHTADYASQTSSIISKNNFVIGVLAKNAISIKEIFLSKEMKIFYRKMNSHYVVFQPIYIVPFRRFGISVRINIILNSLFITCFSFVLSFLKKFNRRYVWIFNPETYTYLSIMRPFFRSIYDCVDYHNDEKLQKAEQAMLRSCDYVFVNSSVLYKIHRRIRKDVHLVPAGFDADTFKTAHYKNLRQQRKQVTVGYVGGINSRLDFGLLVSLIQKNPTTSFVFVGPIQRRESSEEYHVSVRPKVDLLFSFPNVRIVPYVQKTQIGNHIKRFDICIIPYDASMEFNRNCFPMKLFEYFYMGKPVISTPISELDRFSHHICVGKTVEDWTKCIKKISHHPPPAALVNERRRIAIENSWDNKIKAIYRIVD